jgi:hypothetical protein
MSSGLLPRQDRPAPADRAFLPPVVVPIPCDFP